MTDAELGERVLRAMGAFDDPMRWTSVESAARGWPAVALLAGECERRGWHWGLCREHAGEFEAQVYTGQIGCAPPFIASDSTDPGRAFALAFLEACGG